MRENFMAVSDSLFNTSKIEDLFWASALSLPVAFLTDNDMYKFGFEEILPLASSIKGLGTRLRLGSGCGGQNNDMRMRFFVWINWNIQLEISRNSRYINTKTVPNGTAKWRCQFLTKILCCISVGVKYKDLVTAQE